MAVSERETADILSSFTLLVFLFKFYHHSFPAAAVIIYGDCRRAQEGRDEERPENAVPVSRTDAQQVGKGDPGKAPNWAVIIGTTDFPAPRMALTRQRSVPWNRHWKAAWSCFWSFYPVVTKRCFGLFSFSGIVIFNLP